MRLVRLLIAGAVAAGAAIALKRLLGEDGAGSGAGERASASAETGSGRSGAGPGASPGSPGGASAASVNGGEPTKAELYERAQELGIEGRSRMSKQELKRAIESAG